MAVAHVRLPTRGIQVERSFQDRLCAHMRTLRLFCVPPRISRICDLVVIGRARHCVTRERSARSIGKGLGERGRM